MVRGFVLDQLPSIIKGLLNEEIRIQQVDVKKAVAWVNTNESLLAHVPVKENKGIRNIIKKLGITYIDDSWITTRWLLDAIRANHPALYSLMLGWPKGQAWCDRQVQDIKAALKEIQDEQVAGSKPPAVTGGTGPAGVTPTDT
jgi:hypothetical protein